MVLLGCREVEGRVFGNVAAWVQRPFPTGCSRVSGAACGVEGDASCPVLSRASVTLGFLTLFNWNDSVAVPEVGLGRVLGLLRV